MSKRSSSFWFNLPATDVKSSSELSELRGIIKADNIENPNKQRVVLQGRLGENNPNAWKYSVKIPAYHRSGSGSHSHQRIQNCDAASFDVYVYNRNS